MISARSSVSKFCAIFTRPSVPSLSINSSSKFPRISSVSSASVSPLLSFSTNFQIKSLRLRGLLSITSAISEGYNEFNKFFALRIAPLSRTSVSSSKVIVFSSFLFSDSMRILST